MTQLKVGDVVKLKSGGPAMTVASVRDDIGQVTCTWFLRDELKNGWFSPDALEPAAK